MTIENIETKMDEALSAPAASEEAKPSESTPADDEGATTAEMLAFLKGEDQEEAQEPAEEAKAQTQKAKSSDDDEAAADADESDEGEEAEAEAKSDDESDGAAKKPSGWQKSKRRFEKRIAEAEAQRDEAAKRVEALEAKEREYERLSAIAIDRLKEYEQRLQAREERLTELGAGPDPHEQRVAELERQLREERQQREFEARQREEQQQRAAEEAQRRAIAQVKNRVQKVAEDHGIDADDLAVRAAGLAKAARYKGLPVPSLEDVAQELVALSRVKAGQSTERQAEVSRQAPRSIRGAQASPVVPNFEATTEGMAAYLKSIGQLG